MVADSGTGLIVMAGPAVRLSPAEEKALNVLLARYGGLAPTGQPWYRLEWGPASNEGRAVPLCFFGLGADGQKEPAYFSYHLLGYEMPSAGAILAGHMLGEDHTKGSYACLVHFVDPITGEPFRPTATIVEIIIPALREAGKLAVARAYGDDAAARRLRAEREQRFYDRQRAQKRAYELWAEEVLDEAFPPFLNPYSGPAGKQRQFADLHPSDLEVYRGKSD
jgi:hypothetical protein